MSLTLPLYPLTARLSGAFAQPLRGSATSSKLTSQRPHTPHKCLAHRACPPKPSSFMFLTRAQRNARTLQPAALAFVPYGFVLVRVRVRSGREQMLSHNRAEPFSNKNPNPGRWTMKNISGVVLSRVYIAPQTNGAHM